MGEVLVPAEIKKTEKGMRAANSHPKLVLNEDATFTLSGGSGLLEGTWNFSNDTVTLSTTKIGGKPIDVVKAESKGLDVAIDKLKSLPLPVETDGSLWLKGGSTNPASITFKKVP